VCLTVGHSTTQLSRRFPLLVLHEILFSLRDKRVRPSQFKISVVLLAQLRISVLSELGFYLLALFPERQVECSVGGMIRGHVIFLAAPIGLWLGERIQLSSTSSDRERLAACPQPMPLRDYVNPSGVARHPYFIPLRPRPRPTHVFTAPNALL